MFSCQLLGGLGEGDAMRYQKALKWKAPLWGMTIESRQEGRDVLIKRLIPQDRANGRKVLEALLENGWVIDSMVQDGFSRSKTVTFSRPVLPVEEYLARGWGY